MNFVMVLPRHICPTTIIAVLILVIPSVSSFDCSLPAGEFICECTATSIECSGNQTNISEIEDALKLANFSGMETVVLKINDLKFGQDFTFANSSIRNLTLGYGLQNLSSGFFSEISTLVSLNLENNSIQDIDDQLFSSLPSLEELFLEGNILHDLTSSMFAKLTKLRYLSITRNKFRETDADVFQNLTALETLILNHNNISSIGNLRMISTSLTELKTTHCSMKGALENGSFSGVPNLQHLDISHNELSVVNPHSLSTLKDLKFLDLSYNSIQYLLEYAFSELRHLTSLNLRGNKISVIKLTSFENQNNLVSLDLSANDLTAILCQYTTDFDSLEKIYLQDNKIKTFTQGAFFFSPNLEILNVTGNRFECSCSLTDSALYLIENSTMKREDLDSVSCIIPSPPHTSFSVPNYNSSKCAALEPCKKTLHTETESSDDGDYDYPDYSDETGTDITTDDETTVMPGTAESAVDSTTSSITNPINGISASSVTTVPSTESTMKTTVNTAATSTPTTEITPTVIMTKSTPLSTPNGSISDTPATTESATVSSMLVVDSSISAATPASDATATPPTESSTQSKINTTTTAIPRKEPVSTVSVAKKVSLTATTIKTTSAVLTTDVSTPKSTASSTLNTTVARTTPSSMAAGASCSSLDLSVPNISSDSNFMTFKNFSYDGSTFCLKWTIVGDLSVVKSCAIKYTYVNGSGVKAVKCPLVTNQIQTWSSPKEIFKICLTIYAPRKTSFCNTTWYETTTGDPTDIYTPTTLESVDSPSPFSIIAINVYFNKSNLAFVSWAVNREVPLHMCDMTLTISTTTQYAEYEEGVFDCKNDSHRLRNVKETELFKVCIESHHKTLGNRTKCSLSASRALESKSQIEDDDPLNIAFIPLICLLILLLIIAAFIVFKNVFKKQQESNKYDVRAEEVKYQQRVEVRPRSANNSSTRFSYLAMENYEKA